MKHFLLLFCFCSAMGLAQTTTPHSTRWQHVKADARKSGLIVAKGAGIVASVAIIPLVPAVAIVLAIHCSKHQITCD